MGYFDFPSPPCGQYVIAPYIVDFYCHEIGLIIELDGSQHGTNDLMISWHMMLNEPSFFRGFGLNCRAVLEF